jgi:Protein of unknown function (DUF3500)
MLVSKEVKFRTRQQVIQVFRGMILAAVILTPALVVLSSKSAKANTPQSATSEIVEDANAFRVTLSEKQRSAVLYKFDDDQQRVRWSNSPTGFVPRGGLSLEELSDTLQKAALALVASTLSQRGFEKVEEIREADDVFKAAPHQHPPFGDNKDGGP